jgi:CubicO group peptidase (beta-lactamase class C family)
MTPARHASRSRRRLPSSWLVVVILAGATPADASWEKYVRQFEAYVAQEKIVGASTVLVRDERVVERKEIGFADEERAQRVDRETLFHYGSITKTLVGITVLQLRDRGKLSLDDPIERYVPEFSRLNGSRGLPAAVTLRMLLNHTSGLQNPTWPWKTNEGWEPFEPTTWEQLVAMLPYQRLHFHPGARYSYSNPAFIYLARVVEVLSGEPWLVYVQKNVFSPLGMDRSYFSASPYHLAEHRSNNYTVGKDGVKRANGREFDPGITNPNGGWNAPVDDVARYVAFLAGSTDPATQARYDRVLIRTSLDEMFRPAIATDAPPGRRAMMGLSFFVLPRNTGTFVGHTGSQAGFKAWMYFNPRTRTGVIAVFNTDNQGSDRDAFRKLSEQSLEALQ